MSNPKVEITDEDIERLKHRGHLHKYTDDSSVNITIVFDDD